MAMIPATFAFIDKGQNGFPLYIKDIVCDSKLLWEYYHNDNPRVVNAAKDILGIPEDHPTFSGVFVDYLVEPDTGKVCRDEDGATMEQFLQSIFNRHDELLAEAGVAVLVCSDIANF